MQSHQMRLILQENCSIAESKAARRRLRDWCCLVRWVAGKNIQLLFAAMVKNSAIIEGQLAGVMA